MLQDTVKGRRNAHDAHDINPYTSTLANRLIHQATRSDINLNSQGWQLVSEIFSYAASAEQRLGEQQQRIEDLERLSVTDELTGLVNRRGLKAAFGRELARAARSGRSGLFAFLDLDDFKSVNDRYGHDTGDRALRHMAALLRQHFRPSDITARLAGDEFALLLPECSPADGEQRLKAFCARLAACPLAVGDGVTITLSCTCGLADFAQDSDPAAVINRADAAMYSSKINRNTGQHVQRSLKQNHAYSTN